MTNDNGTRAKDTRLREQVEDANTVIPTLMAEYVSRGTMTPWTVIVEAFIVDGTLYVYLSDESYIVAQLDASPVLAVRVEKP